VRNASASLRSIAVAQADFRANDRDGNRIADYWRADVAGLYAFKPPGGETIRLIELSIACADDRAATDVSALGVKSPKAGFWYRATRLPSEASPDPDRFAASCHPVALEKGRWGTYVIREDNVVHKKMLGHANGIDVHPADPAREGWEKLD
jgi:hypothetical protein